MKLDPLDLTMYTLKISIYADDVMAFYSAQDPKIASQTIQEHLNILSGYYKFWRI